MMRSMYSGVSGLRNHQTRMDVIANNIANVNTVGFKKDRVNFMDVMYQVLSPPAGATNRVGSAIGRYVGIGVGIGSIDTPHTQGAVMNTGNPLDLMIQGDGFFILGEHDTATGQLTNERYTRAGVFGLSKEDVGGVDHSFLVNKENGLYVGGVRLEYWYSSR